MAHADREIVENALSPDMVAEIWTGNYEKVLPITLLDFELSAVLPAVFYMFRFGHRRGVGNFLATYGPAAGTPAQKRRQTTVDRIAANLAETHGLAGFDGDVEQAILGDLLLCFCLENVRHRLGRDQQVQRVAPTHYLASWIDLPYSVAHLRFVPEMIVAMLANRRTGDYVTPSDEADRTRFAVVNRYEHNLLLRAFDQGVTRRGGLLGDLASDRFNESDDTVGLDQLLTIRLAQQLGRHRRSSGRARCRARTRIGFPTSVPSPKPRRAASRMTSAASCVRTLIPRRGTPSWTCWSRASRSG